jgi:hypothetical protein
MNAKQIKKRQNQLSLLKQLNAPLEYIIQLILDSRIKEISEKNLIINYSNENKNKLIELQSYGNNKDINNFEYNIYIIFNEGEQKELGFIVENWKFKISIDPELNELTNEIKKKLIKKLKIFTRSIQSLQYLLPLNDLINNNFNYTFQAQIYKESNISMDLENEIKDEKGNINLEMMESEFMHIKLIVNYITKNGIITHNNNLKKLKNDNIDTYFSQLFVEKENDQRELMFSSIIQKTIIEKKNNNNNNNNYLNEEDMKQIKKEVENKNVDFEKFYISCFDNIEDIDCRKNIDEILDMSTIMSKENQMLNDVKEKFNFEKNNKLVDLSYEEMSGIENKDLIQFPLYYYKEKKNDNYNDGDFNNLINDYFNIKHILSKKN